MPVAPLPCPLCAGMIQVDTDWAGRQVACPLCSGAFVLPPQPSVGAARDAMSVVPPPPPLPPEPGTVDDAADLLPPEATVQEAQSAGVALDRLLPPSAGIVSPKERIEPPPSFAGPTIAIQAGAALVPSRRAMQPASVNRLTPKERAQRRLVKNAVIFGVCIVALVVVFYLLAR